MLHSLDTIAVRRRAVGLTQSQLAGLSGVSQSYIAKLEAKKIEPSYNKVKAILEALAGLEQRMEKKVGEIMTTEIVSIGRGDTVQDAANLMSNHGFSQLPVLEGEQSVGSVSEKTIIEQIVDGKGRETVTRSPVSEIMEDAFPQVGEDAPVSVLTSLLKAYPAILVSNKGKIIGIITKADLLKTLS